ncbi:MAG: type II 3-dehydroquinate dehydratase [Candidatus Krumholzibacteria bacterium]|nr:type II 3-dehydroquinate dehydratase [Candidatus Krumholzibacteria bacterium]
MKILVIHGPNLNLLGTRNTEIYGTRTLAEINVIIVEHAKKRGATVTLYQNNHEGNIIDKIHELAAKDPQDPHQALIINPGAYTHYSFAIRDAIEAVGVPAVEVHLSDIQAREEFRSRSVIAPVCRQQIVGLGYQSYLRAIDWIVAEAGRSRPG